MIFEEDIFTDTAEAKKYYQIISKKRITRWKCFAWKIQNQPIFRGVYAERLTRIMTEADLVKNNPDYTRKDPLRIERLIIYLRIVSQKLDKNNNRHFFFALNALENAAFYTFKARKRYSGKQ